MCPNADEVAAVHQGSTAPKPHRHCICGQGCFSNSASTRVGQNAHLGGPTEGRHMCMHPQAHSGDAQLMHDLTVIHLCIMLHVGEH